MWHRLRQSRTPLLVPCRASELGAVLDTARRHGSIDWVFIDGPPQNNEDIAEMMLAATLVLIPTRPAIFDIAAATATIDMARRLKRPFFVALNATPPKRGIAEVPLVTSARKTIEGHGRARLAGRGRTAFRLRELAGGRPERQRVRSRRTSRRRDAALVARRQRGGRRPWPRLQQSGLATPGSGPLDVPGTASHEVEKCPEHGDPERRALSAPETFEQSSNCVLLPM